MPDLPKTIRVGYRDYAVEAYDKPPIEHAGECDSNWASIKIDVNYGPQRSAELLMHELLHAVYRSGNLAVGDEEERVVTTLANQLAQVWRDNPEFVTFMSSCLWSEGGQ